MADLARGVPRRALAILFALAWCLRLSITHADDTTIVSAREHFDRGVAASRGGDLAGAAEHFEHALSQGRNPIVLYNLGQTYSALGRPVQAERALREYLEHDATLPRDVERRAEVEALLRFNEARVGELVVTLDPPDAALEIDGLALARDSGGFLRLAAGVHVVVARRTGYHPTVMRVEVKARERAEVRLGLSRKQSAATGLVRPTCHVPATQVLLDGVRVGTATGASTLVVAEGDHVVHFERLGYRASPRTIRVSGSAPLEIACRLELDPALAANERAELDVVVNESGARVMLNGEVLRSRFVPPGPHLVEVRRDGFESWRKTIHAERGKSKLVLVTLEPTEDQRRAQQGRVRTLWGYAAGGAGAIFAGLSTTLFLINQDRYGDWQRDERDFDAQLQSGERSASDASRAARLHQRAADIQRLDDVALGTALLSGALFATSVGLLFGGESSAH
jgi:hypothetical protein